GSQHPVRDGDGGIERLELASPGIQSGAEYDRTVRDITNFLAYVGEPAAAKRRALGVWVILFLAGFSLLAWLLKEEYWKDVHRPGPTSRRMHVTRTIEHGSTTMVVVSSSRMRNTLTLFSAADCVVCHRIRLVLAAKGVSYELVPVD